MSLRFWEAMKALEEGKKIRRKHWDPNWYLVKSDNGQIRNSDGKFSTAHRVCGNWELYEESQEPEKLYRWMFKAKGIGGKWWITDVLHPIEDAKPNWVMFDGPWIEKDGKLVRVEE